MSAPTPEQAREVLGSLVDLLAEADEVLAALADDQRCGPAVCWFVDELVRAKAKLARPLQRLRMCLPPLGVRQGKP